MKLTAQEWRARIGHDKWFKMCSACECGPSWDFATEAAAKALNTAVEIGLMPMPEQPPIIADCPGCGPISFVNEYGCELCESDVVLRT